MYRSHNVVIAAGWALARLPQQTRVLQQGGDRRGLVDEVAAQIVTYSPNVRLVRSMQTRVHTRVRQLLGRSAGEDVDVRKDWSSARCVPSWTATAHDITARSLMRRPSDGPNALPPTASVFRRGQSRRSIRCRIDRSGVGILCYCADSRGRKNRSGAAIAVPQGVHAHRRAVTLGSYKRPACCFKWF